MLNFFKKLFSDGKSRHENDEECSARDYRLQVFDKVLRARVPGFSRIYCLSDRGDIYLDLDAPIPGYDSGSAGLWFAAKANTMKVKCCKGVRSNSLDIFKSCLEACKFDDLVIRMPDELCVFYGYKSIVVFKKGETFESLAVEADLKSHV